MKGHAASFGFSAPGSSCARSPAGEGAVALASAKGAKLAAKPLPLAVARKMLGCYAKPQGASKASLGAARLTGPLLGARAGEQTLIGDCAQKERAEIITDIKIEIYYFTNHKGAPETMLGIKIQLI